MTVLEQLEHYRERVKSLQNDLDSSEEKRKSLSKERASLAERVECLSEKQSDKAKELHSSACADLAKNEEQIRAITEKIYSLNKDINSVNDLIHELENNPTLHIEEQTAKMADEFFKYVKEHFEELAYDISTPFLITNCDWHDPHYDEHDVPEVIGIDSKTNQWIAKECDRYFSYRLTGYYDKSRSAYDSMVWFDVPTEWYRNYLEEFSKALRRNLRARNPFKDTFTLKFNGIRFTLELV